MKYIRRVQSADRQWSVRLCALLLLIVPATHQFAHAESQHDVLAFLSIEGFESFSGSDPDLEGFDGRATADFLYTYNSDRFRVLAEYIWSDTESELERMKVAWVVDEKTTLWLGRFHTIPNYWATEYHHGQYMQTSISRPGLEEWEDESGPMPSHVTGVWLEREFSLQEQSALNVGLSAGIAPKFEGQHLQPFDVLDPTSGHDLAISGRFVYRPDVFSTNQVGMTISHNDIAVISASNPQLFDLSSITQSTFGLFTNWSWRDWRIASNFVYFDVELAYASGDVGDEFFLGYVQAEYAASDDWTVFGRTEFGDGEDGSAYLRLLPAVIAHRHMLGVRWDFADAHGLTLEVADTSTQGDDFAHDNFKELRLQWSAVFP